MTAAAVKQAAQGVLVSALLSFGCGGGGCGGPDEFCDVGEAPQATEVQIGYDDDGVFTPLNDGDVRPLIYGSQGGTMIGVSVRVRGPSVPACMTHNTEVYTISTNELLDANRTPRKTYEQADGSRATNDMMMVLPQYLAPAGDAVRVTTQTGGLTDQVVVYVDFVGQTDAAAVDGGSAVDAAAGDAAMLDAPASDAATDAQ